MKTLLVIIAFMGTATPLSEASTANAPMRERDIRAIRRHYSTINSNLHHYSQLDRGLMGQSTEGGHLTTYSTGRAPHKIVANFFGCSYILQTEYYFWNGRLFFVDEVRLRHTGIQSQQRIVGRQENRYYFKNGQLIRWLAPANRRVQLTGLQAWQTEREILEDARQYLSMSS